MLRVRRSDTGESGYDATDRGHAGLADYYAEKGEAPGRWFGAALGALSLEVGSQVAETQMRHLSGEGRQQSWTSSCDSDLVPSRGTSAWSASRSASELLDGRGLPDRPPIARSRSGSGVRCGSSPRDGRTTNPAPRWTPRRLSAPVRNVTVPAIVETAIYRAFVTFWQLAIDANDPPR